MCIKGFDFNAIADKNNQYVKIYNDINDGMRDPKFFLFPKMDTKFLWMFPKRQELHREMDEFLEMLDGVIQNKKNALKEGAHNDSLEENEKDLLSLMIESGEKGEGILSDVELKVINILVYGTKKMSA
jgi:cytochrome P450